MARQRVSDVMRGGSASQCYRIGKTVRDRCAMVKQQKQHESLNVMANGNPTWKFLVSKAAAVSGFHLLRAMKKVLWPKGCAPGPQRLLSVQSAFSNNDGPHMHTGMPLQGLIDLGNS